MTARPHIARFMDACVLVSVTSHVTPPVWWGFSFSAKGELMAIESMGDLLKMFSEVTHEDRDSAIDFVNALESKRVDMLSKSTQQEELLSSMTGKIEELNSEVETLNGTVDSLKSENTQLKAKNYDLLMQVPTGDPIPGGEDSLIDNKMGKDGEVYHISSLFSEGTIDPMNPGNPIPINQGQGAMTQNAN